MSSKTETMTLNLSNREMRALEALAEHHCMSKTGVMRQALRLYQLVHIRMKDGETMMFSGDKDRPTMGLGDQ